VLVLVADTVVERERDDETVVDIETVGAFVALLDATIEDESAALKEIVGVADADSDMAKELEYAVDGDGDCDLVAIDVPDILCDTEVVEDVDGDFVGNEDVDGEFVGILATSAPRFPVSPAP
jgi:hypothetical protein